ncbi:T9SS type A sorting domain-containing protein [Candidatus Kryptobacter tengchongensis]|uniref:Por secretion system C-terminal sorting domain-containing protein n=1 Tax=Kryptobacter tengchongensis TaxID=1643429 RepID=A0A916LJF3_KRYT1|nr:T9SS type A sorting domain-containing protein [Candidatus Kryptobacter tengchongensis]CUS99154.1 Por secretion system C-terminal sorting domain-containing protein [Candidatus Kryptobacter tengchongensis]
MRNVIIILAIFFAIASFAFGQTLKRQDAIWARTAPLNSITVDGKLNEPAWAKAESVVVYYGKSSGLPGSGWKDETGVKPSDPTRAVLKFLVSGNNLYIGAIVPDSSVGGGLFNMFDGFLMNMRDHSKPRKDPAGHYFPAPPFEYFYGWVTEPWADPNTGNVGASPGFFGWAGGPRNEGDSLANIWYAVTQVLGVTNTDTAANGAFSPDTGYVVELRFNLTPRGYNVTRPQGDVIEFNISIYDADWQWPFNSDKFSGNRSWWQGPWGNASWYNVARIYARPDVGLDSPLPDIPPDVVIPNGRLHPAPVIDGQLNESVWKNLNLRAIKLAYGDTSVIHSYPGVGPYRSGYFKPDGAGPGQVLDSGKADVKIFYRGDTLYIGVQIYDQVITSRADYDKWDGIRIIIEDRQKINPDGVPEQRDLILRLDSTGKALADGYLKYLIDSLNAAKVAVKVTGTVNDYNDVDQGWTAEIAVDLTKLGYPSGRGDGILFFSATLFDYDEFSNPNDNYGTRTWFFREMPVFSAGPAWAYMDPNVDVPVKVPDDVTLNPSEFKLLGNYPNPFNPTTNIMFTVPHRGTVTLKVYDLIGRTVALLNIGEYEPGYHEYQFNAGNLSSGIYFYQLEIKDKKGSAIKTNFGKMALIK